MTHVYLVSKKDCVIGIFSNRTWMIGLIGNLFNSHHIKGVKNQIPVTAASIGTQMKDGFLQIYNSRNEVEYRIWDLNVNSVNPQYKERK